MNQPANTIWADRNGRFLLETGHYAAVPCSECGGPAELDDGRNYLCSNHHQRTDTPDWITAKRNW